MLLYCTFFLRYLDSHCTVVWTLPSSRTSADHVGRVGIDNATREEH